MEGSIAPGFEAVGEAFAADPRGGSALTVLHHGHRVVDIHEGWRDAAHAADERVTVVICEGSPSVGALRNAALERARGEYVTFVGITGAQNALERVGGFKEGAGDKFKSLDNMGDDTDRNRAKENVRNAITNHPELKALVGIWSYNAPAIVDVVREKNARDKFKIVAFDAEPKAIEYMGQGLIDAMVVPPPHERALQLLWSVKWPQ